jgi:hypothetical protein
MAEGRRGGRSVGGAGRLNATGRKGGAEEARASSAAPEGREEQRRRGRKRRREIERDDACSPIPTGKDRYRGKG